MKLLGRRISCCFAIILTMLVFSSASAQLLGAKGASLPLNVVVTPHFRVLHQPQLEPFARHVGAVAELVWSNVVTAVGANPGTVYILINDSTDSANGLTVADPYGFIVINATFPRPTDLGAQWQDAMLALITHELTHLAHFRTLDNTRASLRGIFGNVPGVLGTRVPPAWFTEGYAVALETRFTTGGRSQDSGILTLRAQMARAGNFPSLVEAGIGTLERYPFGNTRYAFGAGFVPFLLNRFGDAGIQKVLAAFNQNFSFDDAWQAVFQVGLNDLWNEWKQQEQKRASSELETLKASQLPAGERLYAGSGIPAVRGNNLAWLEGTTVRFGTWGAAKLEPTQIRIKLPTRPNKLSFASEHGLVYSRITYQADTSFGEVYKLELDDSGVWREAQLTRNARARDAAADGECILFVHDDTESSSLQRLCGSSSETVFTAPFGWHLFHPSKSKLGQLALTVWRPGGFLDVAMLENQKLIFLTSDRAQDQFPTWLPSGQLLFTSDRDGSFQAYRFTPNSNQIERLSAATGGFYASSILPSGEVAFTGFTSTGFETRKLEIEKFKPYLLEKSDPVPFEQKDGLDFKIEDYSALPSAVFWTPFSARGLGATLYGADPAGINNYALSAGYALYGNPGFEAQASYTFQPRRDWSLNASAVADSSGWSLALTPTWFGLSQAQGLGVYDYRLAVTARARDTGFDLVAGFSLKSIVDDEYGYVQSGWATNASISSLGKFSAGVTLADSSFGIPFVVSTNLTQISFSTQISSQYSLNLDWFSKDGLVGIARVSFIPFLEYQFVNTSNFIIGTQIMLDGVFNYYVPVSIGLEFSYSNQNGFGIGLVTLIPLLNGLR